MDVTELGKRFVLKHTSILDNPTVRESVKAKVESILEDINGDADKDVNLFGDPMIRAKLQSVLDDFYGMDRAVAYSEMGRVLTAHELSHHGVKGMKWGVRKGRSSSPQEVTIRARGKKLKTDGGKGHTPHEDALKAARIAQKSKASGIHTLSNQELADLGTRMNLEQNVKRLQSNQSSGAKHFVKQLLANVGKQQATRVANDVATKKVDNLLTKHNEKKN